MNYGSRLRFLLVCIVLSLLVFTDARILFFLFHKCRLGGIDTGELLASLFYGVRFDVSAVIFVNTLFILLVAFPISFFHNKFFRISVKTIFIVTNIIALLANMIDMAYFPYTLRRTTLDAISFFLEKNDAGTLLPVFLKDFWYLIVIFLSHIIAFIWLYKIIQNKFFSRYTKEIPPQKSYTISLYYILILAVSMFSIRGGINQLTIIDAGKYVKPSYIPLVLNTPFCLINSGELYTVDEKSYMSEEEVQKIFNPERKFDFPDSAFKNYNVVVIIVESLSKEYTKLGQRASYTPFLDSLMDYSLVCTNAFSNGKRSIEGIPSVLASMPSFQYDYISTKYCDNKITSLGNVLKNKGYFSSFFHGGSNGTMNFNGFCANAGFDTYFGRTEYNDERDYDHDWGIWDEPFLQRMADELGKQKEPFVSGVFTLSSHHPYLIPEKYKGVFSEGKLPINKCIRYADYSIKRFFDSAKKQKWFKKTLFVITGDHTGVSDDKVYAGPFGNYQVPLIFYFPDNSLKAVDANVAQQTDVMPTVLGFLKFNQPFFSFGNNLLDSSQKDKRFATNYYNVTYQFFTNENMLQLNGDRPVALFNYRSDTLLKDNKLEENPALTNEIVKRAQSFLQQYNNRVIHNRTSVK